nr:hypothetical protein [Tanacetum cinerariifolium]
MSLDDLYNHLKVYESEVQKKSKPNSQNIAFISSAKHSSGNEQVNTASVSTASTNVSTASANIRVASISQDTAYAYIASQSSGSQIKFEDINQIDEDDMEEMDIKWNMALLSIRADRECRAPRSQDRGRRDNYRQGSKIEEQAPKALIAIDGVEARLTEHRNQELKYCKKIRGLEFQNESRANCIESLTKDLEVLKKEKGELETKLTGFQTASKDLDSLLESLRLDKNKKGLGYSVVSPPPAQIYSPPNKDMSWTGLPKNPSVTKTEASPSTISPKPFIKFVKANDSPTKSKTDKVETAKKPPVKYAEQYRKPTKKPNGSSQNNIDDKGYWDSGCSRHMTGNISYLFDYEPFNGGYVSFGQGECKITGKETIKTGKLKFENVYFIKDLKYNLFSVSQICDNKNSVLFTDLECIVLGRDFKLLNDANVLLRTRRQHNMYSIDLNNIVPHKDLICLVAKVSVDEGMLWHRRLGHLNFKTINRLVRHNLVRGLPSKCFENDHTCTACLKGKQHKASWKFEAKRDEGYFIGYSMSSKAFSVFNKRTKRVEENLHVEFLENKAIEKGAGPNWLFDIDSLTKSMNYVPVDAGTNSTNLSGTKDAASQEVKKDVSSLRYTALPNWVHDALLESSSSKPQDDCSTDAPESSRNFNPTATSTNPLADQLEKLTVETPIPTVSSPVPTACLNDSSEPSSNTRLILKRVSNQVETPSLDNILTLTNRFEDILGVTTNSVDSDEVEADVSNMETTITVNPAPTLRIHKDHPKSQIIGHVDTLIQTRNKSKEAEKQKPKKISDALQDPSWVLKNKKDERGIVIINKVRLVAQGHTQKERIDYDEVFAPVARIEAIRLLLAYALFMGFTVYQMYVKSIFLYGTIDEEVYVMQPPGFQNPEFPARVYKVEKAMYGLHQAPRAWYGTLFKYLLTNSFQRGTIDQTLFIKRQRGNFIIVQVYVDDIIFGSSNPQLYIEFKALMHEKFQMSAMGELNFFLGLQVLQKEDGIFLSQDKYVGDILKKFRYSDIRSSNTLMDKENPWGKDVDLHLYRSMIGSLMYLTASRPDIMFAIRACARHQVTPKECHLYAVKRIFRYLKGHLKLGLWYPKESPFNLVASLRAAMIKPFS